MVTKQRRRADAERNIEAILDAAAVCLSRSPDASMAEIAQAAGVGRVTLYGHFSSREELLERLLERAIAQAEALVDGETFEDDPTRALGRLIRSAWRAIGIYGTIRAAVMRQLPPEVMRAHHDPPMARVRAMIERGRAAGAFRTDLPVDWLVTSFYTLMHAAGTEVDAGNLPAEDAARVLESTLLALVRR